MSRAMQLVSLITELEEMRPGKPLKIVELGAIRSLEKPYIQGDGYSTLQIVKAIKGKKHKLLSIDLDVSIARKVLLDAGIYESEGEKSPVWFIERDALTWANRSKSIVDLLYIDLELDADMITEIIEVMLPKMRKGGSYIVVDDIDQPAIREWVLSCVRGHIELTFVETLRQLIIRVP